MYSFTISCAFYISTTYIKDEPSVDSNFEIISVETVNNETTYKVSQKGFGGKIKADIIFRSGILSEIIITEHNESIDRFELVENAIIFLI